MEKLRPFTHHGVELRARTGAKDAYGECPFCHHDGRKFAVHVETGQFRCWHCEARGNIPVFLSLLHRHWLERTTAEHYRELAADRLGLPPRVLRAEGYAYNGDTRRWLLPAFSRRDSVCNLYTYEPGSHPYSTAGLPQALLGLHLLKGRHPVFVAEGHWDRPALDRLRAAAKAPGSVLATPGASIFRAEWADLFRGRDVYLCYDNDPAGAEGMDLLQSRVGAAPARVHRIQWPATFPEHYDVRDYVVATLDEQRQPAAEAWTNFLALFRDPAGDVPADGAAPAPAVKLPKVKSFKDVLKAFNSCRHMDPRMRDGLAVSLATVLSIQLPGDPIWLFLVGPPGSGKTIQLQSFRLSPWCEFKSSLTPKSLISGFGSPGGDDPSLIPRLQGRVLVLKDYTEILSMVREAQEELYATLRGAYDGRAEKHFGNGVERVYEHCHFGMLAGVTDEILTHNRASLGERFLKFQLVDGANYAPGEHIQAAIRGMLDQVETEEMLARVVGGWLECHEWEGRKPPVIPAWLVDRVTALAQIVAHLRATIALQRHGDLAYRPVLEVGSRLGKQLVKLAVCLCVVLDRPRVDQTVYDLIEQVALDTSRGWNLDIFRCLLRHPRAAVVTRDVIEREAVIPATTCFHRLEAMLTLGTVERRKLDAGGQRGRPSFGWRLAPGVWDLVRAAKLRRFLELPPVTLEPIHDDTATPPRVPASVVGTPPPPHAPRRAARRRPG